MVKLGIRALFSSIYPAFSANQAKSCSWRGILYVFFYIYPILYKKHKKEPLYRVFHAVFFLYAQTYSKSPIQTTPQLLMFQTVRKIGT